MPRSLTRIIRKATAASEEERYQTTSAFIGALEALSFPNWSGVSGAPPRLEARDWMGWDWRITAEGAAGGSTVRRARVGSVTYRKWSVEPSIDAAAQAVGAYK